MNENDRETKYRLFDKSRKNLETIKKVNPGRPDKTIRHKEKEYHLEYFYINKISDHDDAVYIES